MIRPAAPCLAALIARGRKLHSSPRIARTIFPAIAGLGVVETSQNVGFEGSK
jgi:hypothetical protein